MFITRESEYAMRMVRSLADYEIKSVREICDAERIPHKWAYKILKKMEKAKIVKVFYGVYGGYQLDKDTSQISMLDILNMNENTLRMNESTRELHTGKCAISEEFISLMNVIKSELQERTMDKIVG